LKILAARGRKGHKEKFTKTSNTEHPTPNIQWTQRNWIECWMFDVGRWMFSFRKAKRASHCWSPVHFKFEI
jgi:hypothetical protein